MVAESFWETENGYMDIYGYILTNGHFIQKFSGIFTSNISGVKISQNLVKTLDVSIIPRSGILTATITKAH